MPIIRKLILTDGRISFNPEPEEQNAKTNIDAISERLENIDEIIKTTGERLYEFSDTRSGKCLTGEHLTRDLKVYLGAIAALTDEIRGILGNKAKKEYITVTEIKDGKLIKKQVLLEGQKEWNG